MTDGRDEGDEPREAVDPLTPDRASARLDSFDALKGVAIVLVVGIHVLAAAYVGFGRRWVSLTLAFLSLAVPIFIAVSIFFVAREAGYDGLSKLGDPVRRRMRRIIPLYVTWTVLYVVLDLVDGGTLKTALTSRPILEVIFLGGAFYHLYFLPALIQCLLVLPLARWLAGSSARVIATAIGGGLVLGVAREAGANHIAADLFHQHWFLVYFPVVVAGIALGTGKVTLRREAVWAAVIVGLIVLIGESQISSTWEAPPTSTYARAGIPLAVLALLAIVAGMRRSNAMTGALAWLGRRSLGVYLIHPAVLYAILRAAHHLYPVHVRWALPLVVIVIAGSLAITLVMERTPLAWLFGVSRRRVPT